ncbi:SusC/RagA family TonB-linked outer membrane protein [Winogradskyella sediminis]|uniref:TonB-linked outer membrane protein, SusC/RagA family n=1 Tax=Winogradskyella sediminis TaxID=1382466 RepID=A0A1H1SQN0_9FLAO|nr:TonB-dependent receptor [Winogradskyella sediminis]REG89202.1 TonB-linked SusC/RagA family outer membrane protein [Winogradskyella sediminis]SDS49709.1 TonB-linked outer membrane protein, SusC/RagA family [Winogradskyella sediminis]
MKYKILFITSLLLTSFSLVAQNLVTGTITDETGQPIPGVNILEKNTTNGTVSDFDGNYSIKVNDDATIVYSYVGFKTQEILVDGKNIIKVVLLTDDSQLEEVVLIGYGSVKRDKITSSISSVKGEEIAKVVASNPAEALQGKAAGVQVLSSGGNPGASPQILIRGITSNNGSQPLIVVDGVMLPSGSSLNFINPGDIENFQILKDASASAIYGSRASNGVVLITTKRGKKGKAVINIDISHGAQQLEKINMAGAEEYIQVVNLRRTNDGNQPLYDPNDITTDTDWWDEVIENYAPITNVNVRASGGSEKINYAGSLSFFDQQSNYTKGWYQKVTGRFNVDFKISDKVTLKQDLSPRMERYENTPSILYNLLRIDPLTDVYLPQSERVGRNIYSIYAPSNNSVPNPVGTVARSFNETSFFGFFSNTQLDYDITPELTFSSQFGLNISQSGTDAFQPEYYTTPNQQNEINTVYRNTSQSLDYVVNNTLNFTKTINEKHYLNALVGLLYDSQNYNYLNGSREGVPDSENQDLWYIDAATGEGITVNNNESTDNILSGIFRAIYSFDNKYFITASTRVDQSSRFPKDNRTGVFTSTSFAWDVDSEEFFESNVIDNLRLKVGIGEVGNQNISRNGQFFSVGSDSFVFGDERVVGSYLSQFGNTRLKWETVEDQNLGLEMSFFDNALDFSVEVYKRTSKDLLFNVELPNYTGIPGLVAQNVGSFESKGIDFQIGYNKTMGDFTLGLDLNVSTNESKAKTLAPGNEQIFGQNRSDLGNRFIKITEEGETVGLFYGFKTDGIFQNQTEINSHSSESGDLIQPNAQPGDLRFVDANNDGVLNDDDLQVIGNPFADFYGGLTVNMGYKNFDLSMQWYGTYGNDVFNYPTTFLYSGLQDVNVIEGALDNVWSSTNTGAEYPRLTQQDRNGNYQRPSDLFIEDGSYLRLRNIQLGYNFNIKGFQKCRLYVSGQNLITITNYSGFDPEVAAGGNVINDFGIDYARNPITKTYLLGLNLTL